MSEKYNKQSKSNLINLIGKRSGNTPNFALLIGAGASVSSGVKPTCEMISEWRKQLYDQSKTTDPFEKWLVDQDWYEDEEEYSILFETVYDQPAQRRNYIEECVKDATTSWGYIYLADIIAKNYFNVVFTPNFDDLVNEACFTYANCKPIVCSHDSAVGGIRVTSARPKIIKLHGDFLYDNIKNTAKETENLEKNMRDKFVQFAREYGLVVVGYGGRDRSIMDILDLLVRSEGYFPFGIYWCLREDCSISRRLDRFLRRENVYIVEIEGFEEFMAELHDGLSLTLPDTVRTPYKATTERLNKFIEMTKGMNHDIVKRDVHELQVHIKQYESIFSNNIPVQQSPVPFFFLAENEYREANFKQAADYYEKALLQNPRSLAILHKLVYCYYFQGNSKKALDVANRLKELFPTDPDTYVNLARVILETHPEESLSYYDEALKFSTNNINRRYVLASLSNALLLLGRNEKALETAEQVLHDYPDSAVSKINKAIALKRLGKFTEEAKTLLTEILSTKVTSYNRACIYAILGEKENMLKELEKSIAEDKAWTLGYAPRDPDFEDFHQDPDFQNFMKEASSPSEVQKKRKPKN